MLDLSKSMWNLALQPLKSISTSTMLMVNKLGRIMEYCKIMWQTKTILFPIPQDQYHQTWQDGDLSWAASTHKVTQPFGHIVLQSHLWSFFNSYVSVPQPTLGHSWEDSLTNPMDRYSQIQQGSRIDVLKSPSNFYNLFVSIREVFPENFSFIAQFSLTLRLFKVFGIVQKFPFCKFLWFSGTPTFR